MLGVVAIAEAPVAPEKIIFENYRENSTYIETCEVGDTVSLTVDILPEGSLQDAGQCLKQRWQPIHSSGLMV